jgi:hypothetical protein
MKKNKTSKPKVTPKTAPKITVANPFYERIRRGGFQFVFPPPKRPRRRRWAITNPYYAQIVASGGVVVVPMGRPCKHERARPTIVRSFRVAADLWAQVRERAARDHVTTNAMMRSALVALTRRP